MKKKIIFRGTATALITPFSDGKIDYTALERLIEKQIEAKAWRLLEKRLDDGTATAQEVLEVIRRGSAKEELERKQREADIALKQAKVEMIRQSTEIKDLFEEAMKMFKTYHGDEEDA